MTDRRPKPPRRVCPACSQSFMNGKALRSHLWTMRQNGDAAHAEPAAPSVERPRDGKRFIDLTAAEEE